MKLHRFLNPILAGTYFNMSSMLIFITIYLSHKFSHRYLFASTNQWTATRCPSKYTENYFKSRSYGAAVLDCDRVSVLLNLRWDDCTYVTSVFFMRTVSDSCSYDQCGSNQYSQRTAFHRTYWGPLAYPFTCAVRRALRGPLYLPIPHFSLL